MAAESLPREPLSALRVLTESEHELDRIRRTQVLAPEPQGVLATDRRNPGCPHQSALESFTAETRTALASNAEVNSTLGEDDAADLAVDEVSAACRHRVTT